MKERTIALKGFPGMIISNLFMRGLVWEDERL